MNRAMTVAQLSAYLRGVFDDEELLHDVTLTGEVTEVSYSDRHTFITLAEGAYSVRCVHFSARDKIEKGARVALRGSVSFYDKRNSVSFNYSEFFLQGVGDKNARLNELKEKLCALGYFENRPQLPRYIVNVVAITSPDGAAIRDFLRVVYDKNPFVKIRVYPVKVQGDGAAAQMAQAIARLQSYRTDVIVLCRGGGSDEDLDCFNDEKLATAVALSEIPIISAVGHEINYSLCDFCAGTRAGTPSIAGEIVNSRASAILNDLASATYGLQSAVGARYDKRVRRLNKLGTSVTAAVSERVNDCFGAVRLAARRVGYAVRSKTENAAMRLSTGAAQLRNAAVKPFNGSRARCDGLAAVLSALDPHRIIKIGYAAVLRGKSSVSGAKQLRKDDEIELVFADGVATATITGIKID